MDVQSKTAHILHWMSVAAAHVPHSQLPPYETLNSASSKGLRDALVLARGNPLDLWGLDGGRLAEHQLTFPSALAMSL